MTRSNQQGHDADDKQDAHREGGDAGVNTTATEEASSGKAALVDKQKFEMDKLKSGGTSGVTGPFGKPELAGEKPSGKKRNTGVQKIKSSGEAKKKRNTSTGVEKRKKSKIDGGLEKLGVTKHEEHSKLIGEVMMAGPEMIARLKNKGDKVKSGGASTGVTGPFGKPELVDSHSGKGKIAAESVRPNFEEGKPKLDDTAKIEAAAKAVRVATKRDSWVDTGTDERTIYSVLESLDKGQRQRLESVYKARHGISLEDELKREMSGAELDKALNLLHRADGKADNAGRIHTALIERGQLVSGRNNDLIESDLRLTLATMNSKQIEELKREYKQTYGQDLETVLQNDGHLSEPTKKCLEVYLKGSDHRSLSDMTKLLQAAAEHFNINLFKETARFLSADERKQLAASGEAKKLEAKFMGPEMYAAREILSDGKIGAASLVKAHSSIFGDNEKAIESTLAAMTDGERERYLWGKHLSGQKGQELSDYDKKAIEYYKELHSALDSAGNASEMMRWEDMIRSKTAKLKSDKSDDNKRSVLEAIAQSEHWYSNNKDGIVSAVAQMSPAEQAQYRTDKTFRQKVDQSLVDTLGQGPHRDAAQHILNQIKLGQKPQEDCVVKIYKLASAVDVDESAVIAEMTRAVIDDPSLKDRILHPKTTADEAFVKDLQRALKTALDADEYDRYAASFFLTGDIPASIQMELHKGVFSDNKERIFESLAQAPPYERAALLSKDPSDANAMRLQKDVFGSMSDEERQVAENLLKQKEAKPEDKVRMLILGAASNVREIKTMLTSMSPEARRGLLESYEKKYGSSVSMDLARLSPDEQSQLKSLVRSLGTPLAPGGRQEFNEALDQYLDARTGLFGRALVDGGWDGTGIQLDEAIGGFAKAMSRATKNFGELSTEKRQQLVKQVTEALRGYRESKEAAADIAVDAVLAAGALAAAPYTAGVSLGYLLAASGFVGSTLTVASRAAALGEGYDWSVGNVGKDVVRGFINGSTAMLGPAEVARVLKIGEGVALKAVSSTLGKAAEAGMNKVIASGAEEVLNKQIRTLIQTAVAEGKDRVEQVAIMKLAQNMISKEVAQEARQAAAQKLAFMIQGSLEKELRDACKHTVQKAFREIGLNAAASAAGGAAGGAADGLMNIDGRKTMGENLSRVAESALKGAALGGVLAVGLTTSKHLIKGVVNNMKAGRAIDSVEADWYRPDPHAPMLEYKKHRAYNIEGKRYELFQRVDDSPWFYGKANDKVPGPVKVNVSAANAAELEQIQKVLLPQLEKEGSLLNKAVADYRTLDPRFGGEHWNFDDWRKLPDGKKYEGLGFSIATETPEQALEVQKQIDKLLAEKGLGAPGRVGVVREHYAPAFAADGKLLGAQLDGKVAAGLSKKLGVDSAAVLTPAQLAELENLAGIERGLLVYDREGKLALRELDQAGQVRGGLRVLVDEHGVEHPYDYFAHSRTALDKLAATAGFDPVKVLID